MSQDQDEIVFDEIHYREPQKLRRPDRDRRWICAAYEVPLPVDMPVFLDINAADAIERHALRDTSVELGGILLGKECLDDMTGEPFVWVTQSLEAKHYENTQASFTYTHDSWEEITRERDKSFPDLEIVGWYHTHPDFGVFLSSHDLFIHRNFFGQPLQLAYVVDPIRQTRNFFQWRDGRMEQVGGFWITAERGDRIRLARLVNDLENVPPTLESAAMSGGLGSGFSPRLEAELIAMLSRPNTAHSQAVNMADRTQTAFVFSILGAFGGILGLSMILWLNQLSGVVSRQSELLVQLEKTTKETADHQRVAIDASLSNLPNGNTPERFVAQYAKVSKERDDALKLLAVVTSHNDTLDAKGKQLSADLGSLKTEAEKLKIEAADGKETPELRARLAKLEQSNDNQFAMLAQYEATLETMDGKKAAELQSNYLWTWYAALIGWTMSLVFGVMLAGGYAILRRPDPEVEPPNTVPPIQIR